MKVAVVINDLMVRGGTHKQVLRLCEYLRDKNIDYQVFTKDYDATKTYPDFLNHPITVLDRVTKGLNEKSINKIQELMRKFKEDKALLELIPDDIDIVNIHDNGIVWLMLWSKTKKFAKVVWQINDLPVCFRVWESKAIINSLYCKLLRIVYRNIVKRVDAITVNVTKNKDRVIENLHQNAYVFWCGVDLNKKLERHHFPKKRKIYHILSTGVFFERRNYLTLIDVIQELRTRNIAVQLDIIGSTELDKQYAKKVYKHIQELKLEYLVTIWGQVDEQKYNELYNQADLFVFINVNQSWGLAVFEAMSCGLPTIVSNSVGAIELLNDREDSIIVDPMDVNQISNVVQSLLSDEEMYEYISNNAYIAVKEYTWDNLYSSKMLRLFEFLLKKG